jgi:hypothetical protein
VAPAGQLNTDKTGNNKLQAPNFNFQISNKIKRQLFEILNFGHCDLFGICDLLFEIYYC